MAKAFGEAFDVPAEFFANLQQAYDLAQARTPDPSVAVRRNMQSTYPVREMIKRGWLAFCDAAMIETQLARFFYKSDPSEIPYFRLLCCQEGKLGRKGHSSCSISVAVQGTSDRSVYSRASVFS